MLDVEKYRDLEIYVRGHSPRVRIYARSVHHWSLQTRDYVFAADGMELSRFISTRTSGIQSNIRLLKRWQNAPRTKAKINMHDEMIKYKKKLKIN